MNPEQTRRFWDKVEKTDKCWIWVGCLNERGYGLFGLNYKTERVHRISYRTLVEKIPKGMFVAHSCFNRNCVNPSHLYMIYHREIVRRKYERDREKLFHEVAHLLGKISDTDIGKLINKHKNFVGKERKRRGIPAFPCQTRFKKKTHKDG